MYSCRQPVIYNSTDCIIENNVLDELKRQKIKVKETFIHDYYKRDSITQRHCILLTLSLDKWEDFKNHYISIPILKTSRNIYINAFYSAGELRAGFNLEIVKEYIDTAICDFKEEYEDDLDTETLEKMERLFRYGIHCFPRAYLWH